MILQKNVIKKQKRFFLSYYERCLNIEKPIKIYIFLLINLTFEGK